MAINQQLVKGVGTCQEEQHNASIPKRVLYQVFTQHVENKRNAGVEFAKVGFLFHPIEEDQDSLL
jgi:hypothetical protein